MFKKQKPAGGLKFYIFSLDSLSLSRRFCLDYTVYVGEEKKQAYAFLWEKDFKICMYLLGNPLLQLEYD